MQCNVIKHNAIKYKGPKHFLMQNTVSSDFVVKGNLDVFL